MSNDTLQSPQMKTCTKCHIEKPLSEFYKRKDGKCGVRSNCKLCSAEKQCLYQEANREQIAEYYRQYYEENREYYRQHYQENKKKIAKIKRKYRKANREHIAEYKRQWERDNPEKVRSYSQNRRARKFNAEGTHTAQEIRDLYAGQDGKCWYCGVDVGDDYEVDHFIPLADGGSNDVGNLRISCMPCNRSKGSKDPHEWSGRLL
ncbi:HNH endonuclease [Candidatus Kaiserbacteria bacterium]|nr:HNH endonuclease [Candidatus Kaiserbacteria bacterium]